MLLTGIILVLYCCVYCCAQIPRCKPFSLHAILALALWFHDDDSYPEAGLAGVRGRQSHH